MPCHAMPFQCRIGLGVYYYRGGCAARSTRLLLYCHSYGILNNPCILSVVTMHCTALPRTAPHRNAPHTHHHEKEEAFRKPGLRRRPTREQESALESIQRFSSLILTPTNQLTN